MTYRVTRKVIIIYTHEIEAKTAKEAEAWAEDLGEINANDAVTTTEWKAKRIKEAKE